MIQVWPQQLIGPKDEAVGHNGGFTRSAYYLIRALFNRTGGESGLAETVGNNLTATGNSQETALPLSNDYNEVLNGSGNGVILPQMQPGQKISVFNDSGGNINVYPPANGQINAAAINATYSLINNRSQNFTCYSLLTTGGSFFRTTTFA